MHTLLCFLTMVALVRGQGRGWSAAVTCEDVPQKFQNVTGVRIQACQEAGDLSCNIQKVNALSAGHCWRLCETLNDACRLFTYNAALQHCIIYDQDFYSSWTTASVGDSNWTSYYKINPDGWKLLYKISKEIGVDATDAFLNGPSTQYATASMMAEDDSCKCYVKNAIVDNWSKFPITQVAVNLATAGSAAKQVIFSSKGETASTFFKQKNIIRSCWTDLSATSPLWYMNLAPDVYGRAFLILKNPYTGCSTDFGWISVHSRGDPACTYDGKPLPTIVYAPGATADAFQSKSARADALLIYAKL